MDIPFWFYPTLFFVELILLSFISKHLFTSLARVLFLITNSRETALKTLAFFFLPGTVIHELAHVLVAGGLLVHVGDMEFVPEIREDSIKLGSAQIGKTDIFRRALIGVAPVIIGVSFICFLAWIFLYGPLVIPWWGIVIILYAIFLTANTMFSSKKDREGLAEAVIFIVSIFMALFLTKILTPEAFFRTILTSQVVHIFQLSSLFLGFPIALDLGVYLVARYFLRKRLWY